MEVGQSHAFYTFVGFAFAALLSAVGFGVSGHYTAAMWCFILTWVLTAASSWIGLSVFTKFAGIAWLSIIMIVSAVILVALYKHVCPTLEISPSNTKFTTVEELYSFRVENKSDQDQYMNSFMFYLESSAYSTKDFDFQVDKDSLKPLEQQLDRVDYGVPDTFGAFGSVPDVNDMHFFLFYVFHLAPRESRQVTIKLKQHELSVNQAIDLSAEVMSYTEKAVPVSKDGLVVYVPALLTRRLNLTAFLVCYTKEGAHFPCEMRPLSQGMFALPTGCVSLAVISEKEAIPNKILPSKCDQ